MAIKIISDTTADIPVSIQKELNISVVPMYVRFGEKVYKDRVDMTEDQFYQELVSNPIHPTTSQPSPQDFVDVYKKESAKADAIISIHISGKLSGTMESAQIARKTQEYGCPIEIIDSRSVSIGLGLLVIRAARMVKAGASVEEVIAATRQSIPNVSVIGTFDTLKYLAAGGRIGKAKALMGTVLNVKPMVAVKDGELTPAGQARSRTKAIEKLKEYARGLSCIEDMAVVHATTEDEAKALACDLQQYVTDKKILVARLGVALGAHAGPGTLFMAAITKG
jgi:DegV family protein with EDD domain